MATKVKGYLNGEFIPNTSEGLSELKVIKKLFKSTNYRIKVRGRHPDRRSAVEGAGLKYGAWTQQDIPIGLASGLKLYIIDKTSGKHLLGTPLSDKERIEYNRLQRECVELRTKVRKFENNKELMKEIILGTAQEVVKLLD